MGGFEGGDEGGYWDVDTLSGQIDSQNEQKLKSANKEKPYMQMSDSLCSIKAYAKKDGFLETDLYDTISFTPCECESFRIEGCDDISLESNSIYKAYKALYDFTDDTDILDFFSSHKVVVTKRIPVSSGLGGSSSDAAAFIVLVKEVCNLVLSVDELVRIGREAGDDVAFFIYNYSATLSNA